MPNTRHELSRLIRAEIGAAGPISFARFMHLALYHPVHGYYQQSVKQIGCQGDFYTSVSVGSLFGHLLARQFAEWLQPLLTVSSPPPDPVAPSPQTLLQLVEGGAHDGRLAGDILSWFEQRRPELFANLEYWILEPAQAAREVQAHRLARFQPHVRWGADWHDVPQDSIRGIIFSNELLDSFPVVRLGWDSDSRAWFEWRVDWAEDRFVWVRGPNPHWMTLEQNAPASFWQTLPAALQSLLPDEFTIELCPAACAWWSEAAARLRNGKLLTLDYGLETIEFLAPHRRQGTLRSYRGHRLMPDPLADPGDQDLTAHVDFSALQAAGEKAGLQTDLFATQASFLTRIAERALPEPWGPASWTPAERRQFQTLTHPNHLGHTFRVLVQARP